MCQSSPTSLLSKLLSRNWLKAITPVSVLWIGQITQVDIQLCTKTYLQMHIPMLPHRICLGQSYFLRIFARFSKKNLRYTKCWLNKNPKNSMKCSIFRTHGKSENWICIFIWLKSLETKTWKCEFLTFYEINGMKRNWTKHVFHINLENYRK